MRCLHPKMLVGAMALLISVAPVYAEALPVEITKQIPKGFEPNLIKKSDFDADGDTDYVVVAYSNIEAAEIAKGEGAPARLLLVFMKNGAGSYRLAGRNDEVVFAADQGGQCDPFEDGENGIAVKGAYFTVQNSVACGDHWTDFITFKFNKTRADFLFHKRIQENWVMNTSNEPNAEALILNSRRVAEANPEQPATLSDYRPW